VCPACNIEYVEDNVDNLKLPPRACSYPCRAIVTRRISLEKYGTKAPGNNPEARKKHRKTMMENHGVPYAMSSETIRQKSKDTLMEKYGVDNIGKVPETAEKRKITCLRIYGATSNLNSESGRKKIEAIMLERYGVRRPGVTVSKLNREMKLRLEGLGLTCDPEFRLGKFYYDIAIHDRKVLIEINPTYTHSIIDNHFDKGKSPDYHLIKTLLAEQNGYRLIHIWDWDDQDKIIANLIPEKVYLKDYQIIQLKEEAGIKFIKDNHYSKYKSAKAFFGIVQNDELIEVVSMKPNKQYVAEIVQTCSKVGLRVIGGLSCLMRWIVGVYELSSVVSFCDRSKFNGISYQHIGMTHIGDISPKVIWSKGNDYRLEQKYSTTHATKMAEDGWLPIYDCGQSIWLYTRDKI